MSRLLAFLIVATLAQFLLLWVLTHYGIVVLGACSWGAWSWWERRRRA